MRATAATATRGASSSPPQRPATVLPGLMLGAILRRPNRLPAKYAPVSAAHMTSSKTSNHHSPAGCERSQASASQANVSTASALTKLRTRYARPGVYEGR